MPQPCQSGLICPLWGSVSCGPPMSHRQFERLSPVITKAKFLTAQPIPPTVDRGLSHVTGPSVMAHLTALTDYEWSIPQASGAAMWMCSFGRLNIVVFLLHIWISANRESPLLNRGRRCHLQCSIQHPPCHPQQQNSFLATQSRGKLFLVHGWFRIVLSWAMGSSQREGHVECIMNSSIAIFYWN